MSPNNVTNQTVAMSFAARAALLQKYGIPAMPLEPRSKKAFLDDWQTLATTDPVQIAKWNAENPDYNCAAVGRTGGFWILDVDDPTLFDRMEKETSHRLDEIDTLVVKSSGDKLHYYFMHNSRSEQMGNIYVKGADGAEIFSVRGRNAYVVSALSIHPDTGLEYEVVLEPSFPCENEIPTAPTWLITWLLTYAKRLGATKTNDIPEKLVGGSRNTTLASLAGTLRNRGATKASILASLRSVNQEQGAPPLDDDEVAKIAASYAKYPAGTPAPDYTHEAQTSSICNRDGMKLNLVPLSSIEAEIQEWLWENRIPKDALTNLSGDADKGKSLTLYDILARISNGAGFPDGAPNPFGGQPKKGLLMFSEGSLKTTVKPRMMVMGANMDNVITLKSVSRKGETDPDKRQFYLDTDIGLLRTALRENPEIAVIGFDPMTNYLGDNCNMNRSQDVRRVLTPLGELAEEYGVSIIAIIHFSKNTAMSAIHRTGGAAALVEVPRAAWCCADDDDPENAGGFVFVRIKNNLGKRVGGLCYRIEEAFVTIKGKQASVPRLVWGKPTEKNADDFLSVQANPEMKGVAKAKSWLEETFKDGFARKSSTMFAAALAVGINEDAIKRARQALRVESKRIEWQWYMRKHQGLSVPWVIAPETTGQDAARGGASEDPDTMEPEGGFQCEFQIQ